MSQKTKRVAFFRGINVGKAKRIPMSDLRTIFENLGCDSVQTVLNSGNVVFRGGGKGIGPSLQKAVHDACGVSARVTVITAAALNEIADANHLIKMADDPARLLIAIPAEPGALRTLKRLAAEKWGSEKISVGARAAYLWCPEGVIKSALWKAVDREIGDAVTTRNWRTLERIVAAAEN